MLRSRGINSVMRARHSSHWVLEGFARAGIAYEFCALERPDLHREFFSAIDAGKIDLPENNGLAAQLRSMRRWQKDHGEHGDDLLTAFAGARKQFMILYV
jgi:hypothetical protein